LPGKEPSTFNTVGLGEVVAVALVGVDQVDIKLPSPSQQLVDIVLSEAPPSRRYFMLGPFNQPVLHCEA